MVRALPRIFVVQEQLGALSMDFVVIRFVLPNKLSVGNNEVVVDILWLP